VSLLKKVKLYFAKDLEVEFTDRVRSIQQVYEFGEKGTWYPVVVYGPEGCGKTSWLLQAVEVLKDLGYGVIYFNPLRRVFDVDVGVEDLKQRALEVLRRVILEVELARLVWLIIDFVNEALRRGRRKLAVVVDDVFQYLEPRWAAVFVKGMLELIEHPVESYERIVAIVATSEGVSRYEVGRHRWAEIKFMWNMSKDGFKELYDRLLSPKPDFEDIWRLCGGNPSILSQLYQYDWSVDYVVKNIIESKRLYTFITSLNTDEKEWLLEAITDPDTLMQREGIPLLNKLIELNLVVDDIVFRDEFLWIDEPPPEKDLELGVGKYIAWQTPIHREAVREVLKVFK